jgi:hypothetical protein
LQAERAVQLPGGNDIQAGYQRCAMSDIQPALACNLDALTGDERARRSTLASRVSARFREVHEISDGYAACLDSDLAIVRDALEWLLLERRCCPFLRLDLCFEPSDGPVWFRF